MAYVGWNNMPSGMSDALKGYIERKKYGNKAAGHASALGRAHKGAGASYLRGLSAKKEEGMNRGSMRTLLRRRLLEPTSDQWDDSTLNELLNLALALVRKQVRKVDYEFD